MTRAGDAERRVEEAMLMRATYAVVAPRSCRIFAFCDTGDAESRQQLSCR